MKKINLSHIATLANLTLTPDEEKKFEKQLEETLTYIEKLTEINTDEIKETPQVTGLENVLREDVAKPSLTQEEALLNAHHTEKGFFVVPGILEGK